MTEIETQAKSILEKEKNKVIEECEAQKTELEQVIERQLDLINSLVQDKKDLIEKVELMKSTMDQLESDFKARESKIIKEQEVKLEKTKAQIE